MLADDFHQQNTTLQNILKEATKHIDLCSETLENYKICLSCNKSITPTVLHMESSMNIITDTILSLQEVLVTLQAEVWADSDFMNMKIAKVEKGSLPRKFILYVITSIL